MDISNSEIRLRAVKGTAHLSSAVVGSDPFIVSVWYVSATSN